MARQRGSHMILVKEGSMATLSIPDHKEVAADHKALAHIRAEAFFSGRS